MKAVKLLIVWLWIAIPLGWGVMISVRKALPLFTGIGGRELSPTGGTPR